MTLEEAIHRMKEQQGEEDYELAHQNADEILCQFISDLGYNKLVEEWEKVPKWYT